LTRGCTEISALIRAVDPETGGPDLALIKNLVREDLSPVDYSDLSRRDDRDERAIHRSQREPPAKDKGVFCSAQADIPR
jgi:ParB-like chromosome segregation protein Spo0J